ncbi:MAG: peptidylprolyl isomerase [Defluviitaleaceae bacterium]|nr:peptidylprolyl isomerase [Defluviitaleaceae bacterium]
MKFFTNKKKLWAFGAIMAFGLTFMAGCNSDTDADIVDDTTNVEEEDEAYGERLVGADEETTWGATTATNAIVQADFLAATVNGLPISSWDITFNVAQANQAMQWEYFVEHGDLPEDLESELRDGVTMERAIREEAARLAAFYVLTNNRAAQMGVVLNDEEIELIETYIDMLIEENGEEIFREMLDADGIRDREHLVEIFMSDMLLGYLFEAIVEDAAAFAEFEQYMPEEEEHDIPEDLLGAKHILISFGSHESPQAAEEFAQELLDRLRAGENFDELIRIYGEDPGMGTFPNGYTFTTGDMVHEFEMATRALEIGEISDLVPSGFGIHIIMRTEPVATDYLAFIGIPVPTQQQRMMQGVFLGFQAMVADADMVFLPELEDVNLGF